jgi:predicted HNH restriction endonuclease
MPTPQNLKSYPQYAREATSYVLVDAPINTSRKESTRAGRWETVVKFSGHPDGVALARREGGVTPRHLYTLERQGQVRLNTSPTSLESSPNLTANTKSITSIPSEEDESRYPEGAAAYAYHRILERDRSLAERAKRKRISETGGLCCEACGFNFLRTYGPLGNGFIEAHHTVPVAKLGGELRTKLSSLALVCSNCHRMLHTGTRLLSINELRQLIKGTNSP